MAYQISIESLSLTNFGPFYGEKEIDFTTLKKASPHVLIGGANGAGKTHLLRALYLAVAGQTGVSDLRKIESGSDATKFNFNHLLNRRAKREGETSCGLAIKILQKDADSGKERRLTLNREIRFRSNSPADWKSWGLQSDNKTRIEDDDIIERMRDAYLPRHLARFFFFDAEKSQNMELGDKDIVSGISRILGLWSYEELEEDLRNLYQSANKEIGASGVPNAQAKLGEVMGQISRLKGEIKGLDDTRSDLITQTREDESELAEVEDKLKTLGAVDPAKLTDNQSRRQEAAEIKSKLENLLGNAWELALPLHLLGNTRAELANQLQSEEKRRDWEDRKAAIAPRLPAIKAQVFDNAPKALELESDKLAFYLERLDRALKSIFEPPPEGIDGIRIFVAEANDASVAIRQLLNKGTADLAEVVEACRKLELIAEDVRRLDHEIRQQTNNVAAIGAGQALHEKRATLRSNLERLAREIADLDANKAKAEQELTTMLGEEARWTKAVQDADRGRSLAARASAYREAASELRKRASNQLRAEVSDVVGGLWIDIMGRKREFSGIEFDAYWNCFLKKKNGEQVPWDDLNASAGQRQVRLLAFYEALRRLAQSAPPLVVDTPLGRLSKDVRAAVLDKLYLSDDLHQSIVLATDAEIDPDGELFAKVRYRFGRAYTLSPHGKPDTDDYEVEIEPEYFGRKVGASVAR